MALLHWQLTPVAHAKAKRLGRELSIKIELGGSCTLTLAPPPGQAAAAAAGALPGVAGAAGGGGAGGQRGAAGGVELYVVQMPSMVLMDPLSAECPVVYKGEGTWQLIVLHFRWAANK